MSGDQKAGAPPPDDNRLMVIVAVIFACLVLKRFEPPVARFWSRYHTICIWSLGLLVFVAVSYCLALAWNYYFDHFAYDEWTTKKEAGAVYLGTTAKDTPVYLKEKFRTLHAQVIGTTSAGKTESVILPWAIHDVEEGRGVLIVDGKGDRAFLDKLYAYVAKNGREKDFRLFSLANSGPSSTFNPLADGTAQEVTERVFASFRFDNEYYRQIQYKIFAALVELVKGVGRTPTFALIQELLGNQGLLKAWILGSEHSAATRGLAVFADLPDEDRLERTGGLEAQIAHFTAPEIATLFNDDRPMISLDEALATNKILYFQLPTMYYPVLAEMTGRLLLQSFQSAVARRHLAPSGDEKPPFFACMLDDFQDYIYEGFAALLNKSRSANIGVVFSHQALGDLDKVSPAFHNVVSVNTNIKVVMRTGDPDTAEHFAKVFGTQATTKKTERQKRGVFGDSRTGDGSVREVEEFVYHPNTIKGLRLGEGLVSIPHPNGVKTVKVKFVPRLALPALTLPQVAKRSQGQDDFLPPKSPANTSVQPLRRPV